MAARTLIHTPAQARRGEVIELRVLIGHPMETGLRADAVGRTVARDLIRRFSCHYNDELVFSAELFAAVSANPYIAFHTVAMQSGTLRFTWVGDHGFSHSETRPLRVT